MRALYVILPALGLLAIAYRYYSAFIAARIMALDDSRVTPAHIRNDESGLWRKFQRVNPGLFDVQL